MANPFAKVFGFIKRLFVRAGLSDFLQQHIDLAVQVVGSLMLVHDNKGLDAWKDEAFAALKQRLAADHDTWIVILLHLAYESLKAKATEPKQ